MYMYMYAYIHVLISSSATNAMIKCSLQLKADKLILFVTMYVLNTRKINVLLYLCYNGNRFCYKMNEQNI